MRGVGLHALRGSGGQVECRQWINFEVLKFQIISSEF